MFHPLVPIPIRSDEKIVQYWNEIDSRLEIDLEVLDDVFGEADEVTEKNSWLTYTDSIQVLYCQLNVLIPRVIFQSPPSASAFAWQLARAGPP